MLAYIKGPIIMKGNNYFVVLAGDIGYKVFVNENIWGSFATGAVAELFLYHHVREDGQALYGFLDPEQLELFELLLSVSGIGPKSALGVISAGEASFIKESIAGGDHSVLIKVSGIGKKTAERVVMELRDKIVSLGFSDAPTGVAASSNADEIDALMALGYSLMQAREALRTVDPSIIGSAERIREALKSIKN